MRRGPGFALLGAVLLAALAGPAAAVETDEREPPAEDEWVVLETETGRVVVNLLEDAAPEHAENFKKLVRQGYFDGTAFHRVIEGFMAQGGAAFEPDGEIADVGYTLPAEVDPRLRHVRGTVAAARRGDDVNPRRRSSGSQFYICFAAAPWLDREYTIFGHVVAGMEAVDAFARGNPTNGRVAPEAATRILEASLVPADEVRRAAEGGERRDRSDTKDRTP